MVVLSIPRCHDRKVLEKNFFRKMAIMAIMAIVYFCYLLLVNAAVDGLIWSHGHGRTYQEIQYMDGR